MKKLFFIYCFLLTGIVFAKKWDAVYISKLIASGGIDKVIDYYKERYYGINRDPQDAFRIAELYVKKKEYVNAMEWYDKESQLINSSKVNLLNYANTSRLMGEYQKALDAYLMYAALTGDVNKVMDLANQCEKIIRSSVLSYNYKLENYTYNTSEDENYIAVLRTNPVYISKKKLSSKDEANTTQINQIVRSFDKFEAPVNAYLNNVPNLIITGLSFTQDGNSVVFSARDEKSSKKGKSKQEKIYFADNLGGTFLNVRPFPFDTDGFSMKNPSFNANGTVIFFASDQPGGYGGFDIWQSTLTNNKWSTPVNLGNLLNSAANEINPFVVQSSSNQILYFSSDREGGFGGFDIYAATYSNKFWQGVEMQAAPINSAADDISIIYDKEINTGYFSSNRNGGKGGFDIYRFIPFNLKLQIITKDTFTDKIVEYALVQVQDEGEKIFEGVTNENGMATFQINKNKSYVLRISKEGYRPITLKANSIGKMSGDSVYLEALLKPDSEFSIKKAASNTISLDNYLVFTGKVIDGLTNKPATKTKMRMVNYTTQKVREVDIDANGRFEIKLLLNNNYKIIFETLDTKITDELTTLGMERNSIKVRNYLLSGSKFKLTENKVYQQGNLPPDIQIKSEFSKQKLTASKVSNTAMVNEPIRKEKIDSLMRLLSNDKLSETHTNKTGKPVNAISKNLNPSPSTEVVNSITTLAEPKKADITNLTTDSTENKIAENTASKFNSFKTETKLKNLPPDMVDEKQDLTTKTTDFKLPVTETKNTQQILTNHNNRAVQLEKNDLNVAISTTAIPSTANNTIEFKHKVIDNQTLYTISKMYNVSVEDLKKWNALKSDDIKKGQQLNISNTATDHTISNQDEEDFAADMVVNTNIKKVKQKGKNSKSLEEEEGASEKQNEEKSAEINLAPVTTDTEKKAETLTIKTPETKVIEENSNKLTFNDNLPKETELKTIVQAKAADNSETQKPANTETAENNQKPTEVIDEIPDLYYKIQLASYDAGNIKFPEFESLGKIEEIKAYERYIYRLGNFESLERAKEILDMVRTQGYYVAFILQYNKNKITGIVK